MAQVELCGLTKSIQMVDMMKSELCEPRQRHKDQPALQQSKT